MAKAKVKDIVYLYFEDGKIVSAAHSTKEILNQLRPPIGTEITVHKYSLSGKKTVTLAIETKDEKEK